MVAVQKYNTVVSTVTRHSAREPKNTETLPVVSRNFSLISKQPDRTWGPHRNPIQWVMASLFRVKSITVNTTAAFNSVKNYT